jgi:tetratricopeptide (TPR) repeat protein
MKIVSLTLLLAFNLVWGCSVTQTNSAGMLYHQEKSLSSDQVNAKSEFKEGTAAFKAKQYNRAQKHFEKALQLDPSQKNVHFLLARAIHAQFKPDIQTAENISKAREAIAAYEKTLEINPNQEESFGAIISIYRDLNDEQKEREWLLKHAEMESVSREKRVASYISLVDKDWKCSNAITEQNSNKDLDAAKQCAQRGLDVVEKAMALSPKNEDVWRYKEQLLTQMAKVAKLKGQIKEYEDYERQAAQAKKQHAELSEDNRKESEEVKGY